MKVFRSLERKLFPNDSFYQRVQRRRAIFFSLVGVILLILGIIRITISISDMEGRRVDKVRARDLAPSLNTR